MAYSTVLAEKKRQLENKDVDLFDRHYASLKCNMEVGERVGPTLMPVR